ncbi:hypothetical protein Nepgr_028001 [Nepenthes gracilis]|uniref:Uncharacterized protein n=1 Tax=Nepenthes gracilis TaxID=150966 RepID=A0AAD3Y200_NEPGR|nr:hypothetical protein Nepgr_028001 [Nepenthes gracilis]
MELYLQLIDLALPYEGQGYVVLNSTFSFTQSCFTQIQSYEKISSHTSCFTQSQRRDLISRKTSLSPVLSSAIISKSSSQAPSTTGFGSFQWEEKSQ